MSDLVSRNVFIDASIFRNEGFNLEGHKLKALHELGHNSRINVFLTDVTLKEAELLLNETLEDIEEIYLKLKNKIKPFESYLPKSILNSMHSSHGIKIFDLVKLEFQNYLDRISPTVLSVSQVDVSRIFNSYFKKEPPFGAGKKKAEFPDAFSLCSLEDWCERENEKMYVISADKDMEDYCCQSSMLYYLSDLSQFLNLINLEDNSIADKINSWYKENFNILLPIVQKRLKERISAQSIVVEDLSETLISILNIQLNQSIHSTYLPGKYVYAYCWAEVTFEAKGSYPRFQIQKQLGSSWERKVDEYVDFEARWTINCEVEVELENQIQEQLIFSDAWVVGDIELKLEKADKLIVI